MSFLEEFIKGFTHGAILAVCIYTLYTLWRVEAKIDRLLKEGEE